MSGCVVLVNSTKQRLHECYKLQMRLPSIALLLDDSSSGCLRDFTNVSLSRVAQTGELALSAFISIWSKRETGDFLYECRVLF